MYVTHVYSPAVTLLRKSGLDKFLIKAGFYNFLVFPNPVSIIFREGINHFRRTFWRLLEMACGMSKVIHTDMELMPTIVRNEPGGTSVFNGKHWLDNMNNGDFNRFDYGNDAENIKKYGSATVPKFDVNRMSRNFKNFPSLFISGAKDYLVAPQDFEALQTVIHQESSLTSALFTVVPDYNHLDLIWGKDANVMVFNKVIDFISTHTTLDSE